MDDKDQAIVPSTIHVEGENDERITASREFIADDNFVNTPEFRLFWVREKLKNLSLEEIRNFDQEKFQCTPEKAGK